MSETDLTKKTSDMSLDNSQKKGICLGIVGSRNFKDKNKFERVVSEWIESNGQPAIIVSGGAKGADSLAREYANERNLPLEEIHADWNTYGKQAGPVRNTHIATLCTHILAFPSQTGKGTQDTIKKAKARKKKVTVHFID